jgi:polysaccharide biosynthesis/export protein
MTLFRFIAFSTFLLPALVSGLAQPTVTQPVLSAEPVPAAPTGPAVPAILGPPADLAGYIIGSDDSIKVDVFENPRYSTILPVRPDGMITLADVGDIPAAGRTPMQLTDDIKIKLKKFVVEPSVTVTVLAVNSKRIYLIGEVGHVGPLSITPAMTVLQAIASAGGLTPYANKKHIYILRGDPGKQQKIPFDYTKALKKGDMQGVSLLPGDTIVVPE